MYPVILTLHSVVCALVVLIVLIQAGRSGGFSGLFGGGGGDALFSTSSQQSGLRRITVILAGIFMATSFFLTILSSRRSGQSVIQRQFPALPPVNLPTTTQPKGPQAAAPAAVPEKGARHPLPAPGPQEKIPQGKKNSNPAQPDVK